MRRFSTYLHVAQPTKEDRIEILKNVANDFHSLTEKEFSNLGDMTAHYSAVDIARAGNNSINWYYQELLIATGFKKTCFLNIAQYNMEINFCSGAKKN